jgi:serine/threonine protein kinase
VTAFPEGPGTSPGFLLWRVTLRWQRLMTEALRPLGLTHVQFVLLACAWWLSQQGQEGQAPNQLAIATQAGVNVKMASEVLRRLEEKGLVEQRTDPRDRRAKVVTVTPGGVRLAEQAIAVVERADAGFFGAAPPSLVPALQSLATTSDDVTGEGLARQVAVKVIRPDLASDPLFRARFAQEVATARTVGGIFTVPVVDADVDAPQPWLVTAYVEGPSLADAVARRGPMTPGLVLTLAAGLAEGLEVIHAAGVLHRDLKPSNVLLAPDGPRIIDFGISRATDASGVTVTGFAAGSPGYMSPEHAMGSATGPPSDIFSLGSVLMFAATGTEPFGPGTAPAVLYRVVHERADTSQLAPPLRPLVERCMAKDPWQRPTAAQLVVELGALTQAAQHQPETEPLIPWTVTTRPPGASLTPPPAAFPPPAASLAPAPGSFRSPLASFTPLSGGPGSHTPPFPQPVQRPRRGPAWAIATATVAAIAAAAAVVMVVVHKGGPPRSSSAGVSSSGPSSTLPGSTPVSPASPVNSSPTLAGWVAYQDSSGLFSIDLPPGWSESSTGNDAVFFTGPDPGYTIQVAWTTTPQPDAYEDWQNQAAAKSHRDPSYQQVSISRVAYRNWNAADWDFKDTDNGQLYQYLDRAFIVTPGQLAYAIELSGPDASWPTVQPSVWSGLLQTFQPTGTG